MKYDPYSFTSQDHILMCLAMEEAKKAEQHDEVPIGAVIIGQNGEIIAKAGNRTRALNDPCAHAEIIAIREACKKAEAQRIPNTAIYITLEPCTMCATAISFARIKLVIFGASDPKGGGILHGSKFYEQSTCHHRPTIAHGLMENECGQILKDFFKSRR